MNILTPLTDEESLQALEAIDTKLARLYEDSDDVLAHRYEAFRATLSAPDAWFAVWQWLLSNGEKP